MFNTIRSRLIVVGILLAASIIALIPRDRTVAYREGGRVSYRTERKIPVNLGLDLQGGMHLALELDQSKRVSADPAKDAELAVTVLRKRIDEFGVLEPLVQRVGKDRIVVELPGLKDPARAKGIVQRSAFLEMRITDKTSALEKAMPSMDRALRDLGITAGAGAKAKSTAVEKLLGGDSTKAAQDTTKVEGGVLASLIQANGGGTPGEYLVGEAAYPRVDSLLQLPQVHRLWPRGIEFFWDRQPTSVGTAQYRYLYALEDKPIITGSSLVNAQAQVDPLTNQSVVLFELDRLGGRKFGQETGKHVNDYMAILLDNQVQGRPPVIQSRIERRGEIRLGSRSLQDAQDLALTLRAGALPIPLKIVEERQVLASLGQDSIRQGITAGIVGTLLVILVMVGYYGLSGVLAVSALVLYGILTFGTLSVFEATLTLPGLAGFVLSIGIAVDANVLIFERMREELALGKTVRLAIDEGFKHAMPAIIDSNLATVLTALFLFQFGTGPVKGFAVTLIIGIFASLITAVFFTRTLYMIWLKRRPDMATIPLGNLRLFKNAHYDFISYRRIAYGVTGALLAVGLAFLIFRGVNESVEFTGGTLMQIKPDQAVTVDKMRSGLDAVGLAGAEIQPFAGSNEFMIRARVAAPGTDANNTQATATAVTKALDQIVGPGKYTVVHTESVGPKVGGELRRQAFLAMLLSFIAVLIYLAFRFEWRFGVAAVIATAHDIFTTIGFIAVAHLEVSLVVVAGVLTMVGYSLNDTIIIFDRVREHLRRDRRSDFAGILNQSINETLPRSILTHGTTLGTLLALAIFGGEVIRPFALVMFFGVFTGTFSSIFIAAPVLLYIEQRWPGADARGVRTSSPGKPATAPNTRRPQPAN
ncbi:MAG: protein translocase subunit SecD [Gemmatimonadota bacterium]